MRDNAIAVNLDATMRSDLAGPCQVLRSGAGQLNSLGACLVWLSGTGACRAHVQ
jgi:hypothetical protein